MMTTPLPTPNAELSGTPGTAPDSLNPYRSPQVEPSVAQDRPPSSPPPPVFRRVVSTLLGICCMAAFVVFSWLAMSCFQSLKHATTNASGLATFIIGSASLVRAVVNLVGVYFALRHRTVPVFCLMVVSIGILVVHGLVVWRAWY